MSQSTKRILSTIAIVIASVAFGVLISADFGLIGRSNAQTTSSTIQTRQGAITSVTIPSFADLAARIAPAVVSIRVMEIVKQPNRQQFGGMDPFDFFFGQPGPNNPHRRSPSPHPQTPNDDENDVPEYAGGSGFIISPEGYILTNNHVVENASKVEVHYGADADGNGGRTVTAKIIGRDPATDIALIKIDTNEQLPTLPLGDSDRIRKGDWAIAIGNPFQLENTLTVGVISAKGRSLGFSEETRSFENFIQTDASINPGNSGGPLVNISGEVVGINTAIRGGGAQGLGFATPINTAKRLLPQLKTGKVTRGYLGMTIGEVTSDIRDAFQLPAGTTGAVVQDVTPGKPAQQAGIQHGDVIVDIDGRPIHNNRELIDYISYLPVGSNVKLTVIRNGQRQTITAKTAVRPTGNEPTDETESASAEPARNKLGISVSDLTAAMRESYGLDDATKGGVVVTSVKAVSAAAEGGLSEGDLITEVQGQKINNSADFRRVIDAARSSQKIRVYVTTPGRGNAAVSRYAIITVP